MHIAILPSAPHCEFLAHADNDWQRTLSQKKVSGFCKSPTNKQKETHQPRVATKSPIPRNSTKVVQNMSRNSVKSVSDRKATAKANDATAKKKIRMATNAGSSRAHWFFVSRNN